MPPKGKTNNPAGRPKGVPNRTTSEIRKLIIGFIDGALPDIENQYQQLDPEKKLIFLEKMLKYVIPAKQEIDVSAEGKNDIYDISKLTYQQLEQLESILSIMSDNKNINELDVFQALQQPTGQVTIFQIPDDCRNLGNAD